MFFTFDMMRSTNASKKINCRSIDIVSNIQLIYLNNSEVNAQIKSNLNPINSIASFYTNVELCLDFIKSTTNEELFLIISDTEILDLIESFRSIVGIFIYDTNEKPEEIDDDLKRKYPKIIDRYSNINDLFKSLEEKIQFIEKQTLAYSLFDQKQKPGKESASFLWYQMLIDILKQIPETSAIHEDMFNKCSDYYRMNEDELKEIQFFRENYTHQQAIQWYTNEGVLYRLLNRALKMKNIEVLYSFRFFIIDLYLEIEREYAKLKNQGQLIVYRAQMMSDGEVEKLKKNIGSFISINGFFSASRDKNHSLTILQQHFVINEPVLFEIHVDLSMETNLFANISSSSSTPREKEILISINSLFQIESIEYDLINHLWNIKMFASDNDATERINEYSKWIEKELDDHSRIIHFGHLLWNELGQIEQAETYFQILLKSLPNDHPDIPNVYMELGHISQEIGEYDIALKHYLYALVIRQKQISKDYIRIALLLNHIGMVYKHLGNIDQAIDFYRQSLVIYETKCSDEENRLHRANTLANLGLAYRDKNDLDTALNYYQQVLSIEEIIYPDDHFNKANTIRHIGLIYRDKKDWTTALNYLNQTLEIRQHLLINTNHLDIAICYGDIGHICEQMNNLDLALNSYQEQYQIEEIYLPIDHSDLTTHFEWIINLFKKKDQTDKAIQLCEEKLRQLKPLLGKHSRIARILILLATMHEDENPKEADQYFQQALEILEHQKNEEIFSKSLTTMTNFYWKCRMFDRALICQMKLLHFRRSSSLSNENDIAYTLRSLARLYRAMHKLTEALQYFEQSLNILQANYGSEHMDVKNIQKEIFDLKDILRSMSSSANEDYTNRRISNAHKELATLSHNHFKSPSSAINDNNTNQKSSISVSKSLACIIL